MPFGETKDLLQRIIQAEKEVLEAEERLRQTICAAAEKLAGEIALFLGCSQGKEISIQAWRVIHKSGHNFIWVIPNEMTFQQADKLINYYAKAGWGIHCLRTGQVNKKDAETRFCYGCGIFINDPFEENSLVLQFDHY